MAVGGDEHVDNGSEQTAMPLTPVPWKKNSLKTSSMKNPDFSESVIKEEVVNMIQSPLVGRMCRKNGLPPCLNDSPETEHKQPTFDCKC